MEKKIPNDINKAILFPILEKGDKTYYKESAYLLDVSRKIFFPSTELSSVQIHKTLKRNKRDDIPGIIRLIKKFYQHISV